MSYAYPRNIGPSTLPSFIPSKTRTLDRTWDDLPGAAKRWIGEGANSIRTARPRIRHDMQRSAIVIFKRIFTIINAVILLWCFTLRWGERTIFQESIDACIWQNWESWPQDATPHHVAFVADPQLVDPHTYPGRPWPLSTLTVRYTDQYLRRSFSTIQNNLVPDSVLFLGDLFDGGREWATGTTSSPEERYKGYKGTFWKEEYGRFVKIFVEPWLRQTDSPMDGRGRRMIASLPGNHDLGFGNGIQEPVRDRFEAYFGKGNRVDVIGNHTFISVDTPSLSAMDQPNPQTGSSSSSSVDESLPPPIWKDAADFLNKIPTYRAKAEMDELRMLRKEPEGVKFDYRVVDVVESSIHDNPPNNPLQLPAILLTHVPLYRKPATPCGPLRERYPPSSAEELEEDEPNSLTLGAGYQYQNVLTPTISNELVSKAGPNVVQVYSGDDHDYCELTHREFNGSPKEITVKSISWAMGVRRPGFVMTSLWNPLDPETGESTMKGSSPTIQNHLCLLPDQLGIFMHYGCVLLFSVVVLFMASVYHAFLTPGSTSSPTSLLPLSETRPESFKRRYPTSGTSSSTLSGPGLAGRGSTVLPRRYSGAQPPQNAYWALVQDDVATTTQKDKGLYRPTRAHGFRQKCAHTTREFVHSIRAVAQVVLPVYFFLIWRW
ncbi:hypothetical protein N7520_005468 [Penicillium odoratum]|uniref:uncharacterized protein n=1 Tax=Penicillium odoratum TaxID=1167516 RepID=UPI0025466FA0|nr:uncharacterized protein N7520_005468 [Penicillium odoratum]KAJ5765909.1 hypothetical protein N7520_005468 [Penicillium odoratum]